MKIRIAIAKANEWAEDSGTVTRRSVPLRNFFSEVCVFFLDD